MPSHAVTRLISRGPAGEATLELACGCVVTRPLATDRVLEDGRTVVGKVPCPLGHPVRRPAAP